MRAGPVLRLHSPGSETARDGPIEEPTIDMPMPPATRPRRIDWIAILSFCLMVLIPVAVVGTYFARHAADEYVATARFTLRELRARPIELEADETRSAAPGATLIQEAISPFTHVAVAYIRSAALLDALARDVDIAALFRRPEADFWSRLPDTAGRETLLEYWRRRIAVSIDGPSGIVTLHLRAFRPEDALMLAQAVVTHTEALINDLALRQKRDALARAHAEAAQAEQRLKSGLDALSGLRDRERLLDPEQEAGHRMQLMAALTAERIRLQGQLEVLGSVVNADAARARSLRSRLEAAGRELATLRGSLADDATADGNIAAALGRFEELEIRRRFAERLFGLAQARLIEAEVDMARQSVYLDVFDPARLPEESRHPRRLAMTLLIALALATGWAILALIWASVRDHRMDRPG